MPSLCQTGQGGPTRRHRRRRHNCLTRRRLPCPRRAEVIVASAARAHRRRVHVSRRVRGQGYVIRRARTWSACSIPACDRRARPREGGFECFVADPNLWVPVRGRPRVFGHWLRRHKRRRTSTPLGVSRRTRRLLVLQSASSTRSASACEGARDSLVEVINATPSRSRRCCCGEHEMIDIVFDASSPTCSRIT